MVCAGKALNEVITLANQRIAARESKKIEQQGGQFLILFFSGVKVGFLGEGGFQKLR
jgi:hypothetical protein